MPLRCRLERNNPLRRNIICIVKALYRLRPESVQGFLLGNINWSPAAQTTTSVFFHPLCGQKKPPSPRGEGFAAVPLAYPSAREMAICWWDDVGIVPYGGVKSEELRVMVSPVATDWNCPSSVKNRRFLPPSPSGEGSGGRLPPVGRGTRPLQEGPSGRPVPTFLL